MVTIPASIRNNNPGAMQPGPSSRKFGSDSHQVLNWTDKATGKKQTNTCATFDTPLEGAAAMFDLLASATYASAKTSPTIQQAIAKWCGGFAVTTYIKVIEASGLVTRNTPLTRELLLNPEVAIPLAKSMAWQEAGLEFPMDDEDWRRAHAWAFTGSLPVRKNDSAAHAGRSNVPPAASTLPANANEPTAPLQTPEIVVIDQVPAGPIKSSNTIKGAALVVVGFVTDALNFALKFGLEAVAAVQSLAPIKGVAAELGGNTKALSSAFIAWGVGLVVTSRVKASTEGKKG